VKHASIHDEYANKKYNNHEREREREKERERERKRERESVWNALAIFIVF
tara:strand:- start:13 stop:162 length:150 start_codon:yes stop_codon:yes gene_type:complete